MHFMKDCLKGARSPSRRRRNDLHFPAIAFCFSSLQSFSFSSGFITCATRAKTVGGRSSVHWVSWNHSQGDDDQPSLLRSCAHYSSWLIEISYIPWEMLTDSQVLSSFPHSPSFMVGTRISRLLSMPMRRKSCAAYRTLFCTSLSLTYWLISCQIYSHSHFYSHLHTC